MSIDQSDLPDRKLHHNYDLLSYVIEHCRSSVAIHDRELRYIYVSQRYMEEFKVTDPCIIGKHHYEVFPDLPQKWRDIHQRALQGEVCSAEDDPYEKSDGTTEWTRWECRPWFQPDGSIGGIIVYTEVTTERKKAEQEKEQLYQELLHTAKLASIGELASGVAHEINNPLTVASGLNEILVSELEDRGVLDQRPSELLLKQNSAHQRMANIVTGLKNFSRVDRDKRDLVNPDQAIIDTLELVQGFYVREGIGFQIGLKCPDALVWGNRGQLQQVVMNLLSNARDALEGRQNPMIRINTSAHNDQIYLSIADNGPGIPPELFKQIFNPFFTTKEAGKGTGLGLSISQGIIRSFGGNITVESSKDKGAVFTISLKLAES